MITAISCSSCVKFVRANWPILASREAFGNKRTGNELLFAANLVKRRETIGVER